MTPDRWLHAVFAAQAVNRGGVIQRRMRDIERYAGLDRFREEVARRGFQLIENNGTYIVLCNAARARLLVRADPSMDRGRSVDRSEAAPAHEKGRSFANRPPYS
ncbi:MULTISPECIES: N-(5'-phosphoribosyl)anthranilate isomerase [unclassified Marinovum]